MGENDIQSENGRFHGSTSVQRHCGLLGVWNRGGFWDDNAESVRVHQSVIRERNESLTNLMICKISKFVTKGMAQLVIETMGAYIYY
jgi:hypothetical protein